MTPLQNLTVWVSAIFWIAFIGSYLGAYLKKKGENLATHEDIDKLVKQVSTLTKVTKDIEAKISNEVWDRQKRWELKRDVLFEATERIGALEDSLLSLYVAFKTEEKMGEKHVKMGQAWTEARTEFGTTNLFVGVVCGEELKNVLNEFGAFAGQIGMKVLDGHPEAYEESSREIVRKLHAVTVAIRQELEIEKRN